MLIHQFFAIPSPQLGSRFEASGQLIVPSEQAPRLVVGASFVMSNLITWISLPVATFARAVLQ
jgi:hypothetical protein